MLVVSSPAMREQREHPMDWRTEPLVIDSIEASALNVAHCDVTRRALLESSILRRVLARRDLGTQRALISADIRSRASSRKLAANPGIEMTALMRQCRSEQLSTTLTLVKKRWIMKDLDHRISVAPMMDWSD